MKRQLSRCILAALPGLALAALLLWLGTTVPARAGPNTYCVNQSGTGCAAVCGGGCYASVQAAIDAAPFDAEIRIAEGTYTDPGGTVAAITKSLALRGGYDSTCGEFDPDLYHTVLDAQWGGSVVSVTNAGDVFLENLTLTHGDGSGNCGSGSGCGGGIYAKDTSLHIGNCVITDNIANRSGSGEGRGGGIYARASNRAVEMWESRIVSNTANTNPSSIYYSEGGGAYIRLDTVSLIRNQILDNVGSSAGTGGMGGGLYLDTLTHADVLTNVIRGNWASTGYRAGDGGGLYLSSSVAAYVSGNRIEHNWTSPNHAGNGGGVFVNESEVHLTRNTIISNATGVGWTGRGGGVFVVSRRPVTLSNNLIADNAASIYGGGVFVGWYIPPASQALLVNNTIVDNGASGVVGQVYAVLTMTNNLIAGHTTGLTVTQPFTGAVTADHNLFWNASDPIVGTNAILQDPLLSADYHLRTGSPAVDAGLTIPWLTTDLEGNNRPQGSGYDIGAYEGAQEEILLPLVVRNHP